MSDFPKDIREAARSFVGHNHRWIGPDEVATLIARAILAERERLTNPKTLARHIEAVGLVGKEVVAEAILAERRRCVELCRKEAEEAQAVRLTAQTQGALWCAKAIEAGT